MATKKKVDTEEIVETEVNKPIVKSERNRMSKSCVVALHTENY